MLCERHGLLRGRDTRLGDYRGLPLYASESQYTDAAGASQYYVPPDKVLVAASGLQSTVAYAGVVQVSEDESSMNALEGTRIPLVFYEKGYDFRKVRLSSRPIPIPADT
jgi:Phage major capsid protein E